MALSGVIFSATSMTLPFSVKELCLIPSFFKLQKTELILFSLAISCEVHSNHYNNSCTLLCFLIIKFTQFCGYTVSAT